MQSSLMMKNKASFTSYSLLAKNEKGILASAEIQSGAKN